VIELIDNLSLRQPMGLAMRRSGLAPTLEAFGFRDVKHAARVPGATLWQTG
jgi:hypothetical protein